MSFTWEQFHKKSHSSTSPSTLFWPEPTHMQITVTVQHLPFLGFDQCPLICKLQWLFTIPLSLVLTSAHSYANYSDSSKHHLPVLANGHSYANCSDCSTSPFRLFWPMLIHVQITMTVQHPLLPCSSHTHMQIIVTLHHSLFSYSGLGPLTYKSLRPFILTFSLVLASAHL